MSKLVGSHKFFKPFIFVVLEAHNPDSFFCIHC